MSDANSSNSTNQQQVYQMNDTQQHHQQQQNHYQYQQQQQQQQQQYQYQYQQQQFQQSLPQPPPIRVVEKVMQEARIIGCSYSSPCNNLEFLQSEICSPTLQTILLNGCKWSGLESQLNIHLNNTCECKPSECIWRGCNQILFKSISTNHVDNCEYKLYNCEYCSSRVYKSKLDDHKLVCNKRPVECPNHCGIDTMPFIALDDHKEVCPLELLPCPYGNDCLYDCPIRIYRKDLAEHRQAFKKRALTDDLKDMMYGFGADWPVDNDAISLVEKLTCKYIEDLSSEALAIAQTRGKVDKEFDKECFLLLIHRDRKKFARVHKLLKTNEALKQIKNTVIKEGM